MPWDYSVSMSSVKREQKGQIHKPTQPATPIQLLGCGRASWVFF